LTKTKLYWGKYIYIWGLGFTVLDGGLRIRNTTKMKHSSSFPQISLQMWLPWISLQM